MSNLTNAGNNSLAGNGAFMEQLKEALEVKIKSRPYTAYITRQAPSAFVFLLDQSGSMGETGGDYDFDIEGESKSDRLTSAVNKILNDIVDRCRKGTEYRDYFEIAIIGYGGEDSEQANFAWEGKLEGKRWVRIPELAENFISSEEIEVESNVRGTTVFIPKVQKVWIESKANYMTPMNSAMLLALELLEDWIVRHKGQDIYPPTVINITDGQLTDATFEEILLTTHRIKQLHTMDGNVLLLNLHIGDASSTPVLFPTNKRELPNDRFAHLLFDMSSDLPEIYHNSLASLKQMDRSGTYTGMAFNAPIDKIIQMMNIGTSTTLRQIQ